MQMSQTQREFTQLLGYQRISFSVWNQPTLQRLSFSGHDRVMRARALITLKMRTSSALSGMAMIAAIRNCEFTA
jgi:hypothetical protein